MRTETNKSIETEARPGAFGRLRRALHRQLDPEAWPGNGLSPLNWAIMGLIFASIAFGVLATEIAFSQRFGRWLPTVDHAVLAIFAVEYAARLATIGLNPLYRGRFGVLRYALKPASLADLVVIFPLFMAAPPTWMFVIRVLRILRLFRLAELPRIHAAIDEFWSALAPKRFEFAMTLCSALVLLLVSSTALYICERAAQPEIFGSVPRALWWAIGTFTTVSYGDTYPVTPAGKLFAGIFAIAGLCLAAMLTAIIAAALTEAAQADRERRKPGESDEDAENR